MNTAGLKVCFLEFVALVPHLQVTIVDASPHPPLWIKEPDSSMPVLRQYNLTLAVWLSSYRSLITGQKPEIKNLISKHLDLNRFLFYGTMLKRLCFEQMGLLL